MSETWRRRPLYSLDNEDTRSERAALEVGPDDVVVAIAAGGGRALALLAEGPARLVAVDRRAEQLHVLELKAAALDAFDADAFAAFLGLLADGERLDRYAALRGSLSPAARRYWDSRPRLVAEGCLYGGRLDGALLRASRALRAAGLLRFAEALFAVGDLEAQRAIWLARRREAERALRAWRLLFHPALVYAATQDPGFLRGGGAGIGAYVTDQLEGWLGEHLARESFLLRLLVRGALDPFGSLPLSLHPEVVSRARKSLDRLELHCADLRDVARTLRADERIKWSISDVSCWMSEEAFAALIRVLVATGAPGSRLCARHFAARRPLPALGADVRRLEGLGDRLGRTDASIVYRFDVLAREEDGKRA